MEFNDNRPIYLQIADLVMEKIITGTWRAHDRIPSVRELAVSLEVNPNTVMHSYTFLQEQGIVYNRRGIGYHVAEEGDTASKKLKRSEFVREELPRIFRSMRVLDIGADEMKKMYEDYTSKAEEIYENEQ